MSGEYRRRDPIKTYLLPAVLLFAVPLLTLLFCSFATHEHDTEFKQWVSTSLSQNLAENKQLSDQEKRAIEQFYAQVPPASQMCGDPASLSADFEDLRGALDSGVCGPYEQFEWARMAALFSIALGILSWFVAIACAFTAHQFFSLQYQSFVAGWWFLRLTSTLQVLVQGAMLVWLSYWVFAVLFDRFFPKLTIAIGLVVLSIALHAIKSIFSRPEIRSPVDGHCLARDTSPALWARIDELCQTLNTAPPDNIVLGVDDNFFVTQSDLTLDDARLSGRSLYASLSLLRVMTCQEADAVLAHEMAHFSGGDTQYSQRLAPKLLSFELYLNAIRGAYPIHAFMVAYWTMFNLAIRKDERAREFRADKAAAEITSPQAVAHALVKVSGYASFRERIHDSLFESDKGHDELQIPEKLAQGIPNYAHSSFRKDIATMAIPHPFDSHPPLPERLSALGVELVESDYAKVLLSTGDSWYSSIEGAKELERSLWDQFEQKFAESHEFMLAHRYVPRTPQEAAIVQEYFPSLAFEAKVGHPPFELSHAELRWHRWPGPVEFSNIKQMQWVDQTMQNDLVLKLHEPVGTKKKLKVSCRLLEIDNEEFKEIVERYFHRYIGALEYEAEHFMELHGASQSASSDTPPGPA